MFIYLFINLFIYLFIFKKLGLYFFTHKPSFNYHLRNYIQWWTNDMGDDKHAVNENFIKVLS